MWFAKLKHATAAFGRETRLVVERDPGGEPRVILIDAERPEARAELDPGHGWLPRRIELGPKNVSIATRFAREAGHWFPVEGTRTSPGKENAILTNSFAITDLKINRPISDSTFERPEVSGPRDK